MRILHLTTHAAGNGAAVAVSRLHRGLIRSGHDSTMIALHVPRSTTDPTIQAFLPSHSPFARVKRRLRRRLIERTLSPYARARDPYVEAMSDDRAPYGSEVVRKLPECDVITVHAMMGFIDYRGFFAEASERAPVVRVMHDMSFFTGGCHCDWGCGRFTNQCGRCPQLSSKEEQDPSRQIWKRKRAAVSRLSPGRLHVVAPSRWLAGEARRSSLLRGIPVTVIPHGIDTGFYSPKDRRFCREILDLPHDRSIILFVAEPLARRNKGFADLAAAISHLKHRSDLFLLSAGTGTSPVPIDIPHVHQGWVSDERLLQILYSAADILVAPAPQEAFGQTVLEAMACGTPVIGFDAGGIRDLVRHGENGLLVQTGNVSALAEAIDSLLGDPFRLERMRTRARQIAVAEYDLTLQAKRYTHLYETILAGRLPPMTYDLADSSTIQQEVTSAT